MIKLVHVFKEYKLDGEIFTALKDINFSVNKGEFIAIIGPSGSGKSTLMHLIGLLDTPTRGQILVEDRNIAQLPDEALSGLRNEFVGFVFQQFNLINKLTVLENIMLPTVYGGQRFGENPLSRAISLLKRFTIEDKKSSFPNKLSGGQQQRVAIARALINNPKLILADEPTGNLDTKTGDNILTLLTKLNEEDKMSVILVTHDSHVAGRAKRKIQIRDGEIIK